MIRYFQSAYPSRLLVLLILALLIWLPAFIQFDMGVTHWQINYSTYYFDFTPSAWLYYLLSFVLFIVSGSWLNKLGTHTALVSKNSYLTFFVFILLAGSFPILMKMSPFWVVGFLFVLFMQRVFSLQNHPYPILTAFDAGLLLGFAALLFPPLAFLFLFIWLAMVVYRIDLWRAYVVSLLGVLFPYLVLLAIRFLLDQPLQPANDLLREFSLHLGYMELAPAVNIVVISLLCVLLLLAAIQMASSMGNKNISFRQHALVGLWAMIFTTAIVLLFNKHQEVAVLLAFPASLILASFLDQIRRPRWMNLLLWVIVALIVINQYYPLFYVA